MTILTRPQGRLGRLAVAALMLLGVALFLPNRASAEDCGGPLSASKGNIIGSIAGAAGGGLLGNQFGGGAGKGVMTGLGVVGGALAGGYVGRQAEGCDRPRQRPANQAAAARTCRTVSTQATIDGQQQPVEGVACLDQDGVWRITSDPAAGQAAQRDIVLRAQQRLHDQGFYVRNNIDGRWGPATSAALRNFQQANNLAPSGQIDAPTRTALGLDPVPLTDLSAQNSPPAPAGAAQPATTVPAAADQSSIYK
jgi:uncharacterized protein YcfJ